MTLLRDAPVSQGKVGFAWRVAVGAAVERATRIRLEAGVLFVETDSPQWSREVMRSSPVILERLRGLLGRNGRHDDDGERERRAKTCNAKRR